MKRFLKYTVAILALLCLMFLEYRFIMCNICAYVDKNNTVYLEILDQVDEYDAMYWED